ncbi:VOC family protein [Neptunomonas sp.]|uniref:VOC family protein n=1 Tax=Neptunomonas sp. TaxID=1971898 RepID=UPI003561AF7E
MLEIRGLDHIVLRTNQIDRMCAFYCDVLNCTVERETPPELGLIQLRAGNALIDLVRVESQLGKMGGGAPTKTGNNLDHFCLQLKQTDEDTIAAHLASHGIDAGEFAKRYGAQGYGMSVYIKDPEGNTVELRSEIVDN